MSSFFQYHGFSLLQCGQFENHYAEIVLGIVVVYGVSEANETLALLSTAHCTAQP